MRRLILGFIAAAAVLGGALALPGHASAHALRQTSVPDANAVLDTAPAEVRITFGEEPDPRLSHIDVLDTGGATHQQGPLTANPQDPRELRIAVGPLTKGVYTVAWRTVSSVDGHRAAGSFAFGIGVSAAQVVSAGTQGGSSSSIDTGRPSALAVAGRWVLYLGLFALLGAAFTGVVVLPAPSRSQLLLAAGGLVLAIAGTAVIISVEAVDAQTGVSDLLSTSLGRASIERVVAIAATAAALGVAWRTHTRRRRVALAAGGLGGAAAMFTDVSASHAAAASYSGLNIVLQWVHILAASMWIGGLAALLLALRDPALAGARGAAVRRFSAGAGIALGVVLLTGVVRAAVEIGSWGMVLSTDFGRLVIVKVVLISVLAALGGVNRWRHVGRIPARLSGLRRVGTVELVVATVTVLVAATLVNVAPPVSATASTAPPVTTPLTVTASDYATTVRVTLTVSPGTAGFNDFRATVVDYDTAAPVDATDVQLSFAIPIAPDVGNSTLTLQRSAPGVFSARGGNLSIDGSWKVTALIERGANSVEVPLQVATRSPQQQVDVSRVAGEPTLYTIHLNAGRTVQVYIDPPGPGKATVHATFFDAAGKGLAATGGIIVGTPPGGQPEVYPIQQFEPGHYGASATLVKGAYRFDIAALAPTGERLATHIDITIPS